MGNSSIQAFQNPDNEKLIKKCFKRYDKSKDGFLCREEFALFVEDIHKAFIEYEN
jgi:Ca2+-binding EF-hand superfamily protein